MDRRTAILNGTYQHWGVLQPLGLLEPNNLVPPENCAGSNLTMGIRPADKAPVVYDGAGGWADHQCSEQYVSVCKVTGGWMRWCTRHVMKLCLWEHACWLAGCWQHGCCMQHATSCANDPLVRDDG